MLRLHLGLIVPEPREMLGIRVKDEVYRWREGKVVIFDDAYEHEAWNRTQHTRVVLFVDFRKPLRLPANFINWLLCPINAVISTQLCEQSVKLAPTWPQSPQDAVRDSSDHARR